MSFKKEAFFTCSFSGGFHNRTEETSSFSDGAFSNSFMINPVLCARVYTVYLCGCIIVCGSAWEGDTEAVGAAGGSSEFTNASRWREHGKDF